MASFLIECEDKNLLDSYIASSDFKAEFRVREATEVDCGHAGVYWASVKDRRKLDSMVYTLTQNGLRFNRMGE